MTRPVTDPKGFIPAPGVAQIEMYYTHLGEQCENVYHVKNNAVAPGDAHTISDALWAAFWNWESTYMLPLRCAQTAFTGFVCRFLDAVDAPVFEVQPSQPQPGTAAGAASPGNVTASAKWLTARRGRSYRGRTYHIGLPPGFITGNELTNGGQSALLAGYAHLLTALQSPTGYQLSVLSYSNNKQWRDTAVATPCTAVAVDLDLDSQRRRLHGRGK